MVLIGGLGLLAGSAGAAPGTFHCNEGSPAFPAPETRHGIRLWSPLLSPAGPDQQLPPERDSTAYTGDQRPGQPTGMELFTSLEIEDDFLFMAYNSGLSIWDIGGPNAFSPRLIAQRDGWRGQFFSFPGGFTEFYLPIKDLDVVDPAATPDDDELVVVVGERPVGLTIWDATQKNLPLQLYQDQGRGGTMVRAATIGGREYAFFATLAPIQDAGLYVYDLTQARLNGGGCLEDTTVGIQCPGVFKGKMGPWLRVQYLDLYEAGGRWFLALSDSDLHNDLRMEIREVSDPSIPEVGSEPKIHVGDTLTRGLAFFEHPRSGRSYLAIKSDTDLEIYDVHDCLQADGPCGSLGPKQWSADYGSSSGEQFVTFSESQGRPFLYVGSHEPCGRGPKGEHLLDVLDLGKPNPRIIEVTEGGGRYLDPETGFEVDYWGTYYDGNTLGLSSASPRIGKFHGDYFYRAAWSIFDLHLFAWRIFGDGFESGDLSAWSRHASGR